jgi:hypothetical protein
MKPRQFHYYEDLFAMPGPVVAPAPIPAVYTTTNSARSIARPVALSKMVADSDAIRYRHPRRALAKAD